MLSAILNQNCVFRLAVQLGYLAGPFNVMAINKLLRLSHSLFIVRAFQTYGFFEMAI
jgi:hypothetical protein